MICSKLYYKSQTLSYFIMIPEFKDFLIVLSTLINGKTSKNMNMEADAVYSIKRNIESCLTYIYVTILNISYHFQNSISFVMDLEFVKITKLTAANPGKVYP